MVMNVVNPLSHPTRGYQMSESQLRAALGVKQKDRWPDEGIPLREFNGVQLYVTAKNPPLGYGRAGMKHRAYVICPCGEHIPAGRMHQHLRAAKHGGPGRYGKNNAL